MEHNEALKSGPDPDGLSKRRISSILKASRVSIKASGADQDELQEETRPIEKRRNSRRVSFATTNNVRVFSKDAKTESPVLATIPNFSGVAGTSDDLDKKENQQVKGMDTIPLSLFQLNKENFFPDLTGHDDFVDQTLILGEDTGYMDMTHSHTITIGKEDGNYPDLTFSMLGNETEHHTFKSKSGKPCKTPATEGKDAVHSEFSDFLARISKPQNDTTSSTSFGLENSSTIKVDKENVLSCFTKQIHCPFGTVNSQPRGFKPRNSLSAFLQDQMDITRSHTVGIDRVQLSQDLPHSACDRSTSSVTPTVLNNSDGMDLTYSLTATLNFKETEHVNNNMHSPVVQNTSSFVSSDSSGMIMTQVLGEYIQEEDHKVVKDNVAFLFPQANRFSSVNLCEGSGQTSVQIDHFQKFDPIVNSDDTQSQTVVFETKREDRIKMIPRLECPVASERSIGNVAPPTETVLSSDQNDFMDLTCQADMSALVSSCPDDGQLTGCNNVAIDPECEITLRKHACFVKPSLDSQPNRKVHHLQNDLSITHMSDDMEMTKCQTIVLHTKNSGEQKPFVKSRKSFGSDVFNGKDIDIEDMELTSNATEHLVQKNCLSPERETKKRFDSASQILHNKHLPNCMEVHQSNTSILQSAHDMDLTGCKTIAFDTKDMNMAHELIGSFASNNLSSSKRTNSDICVVPLAKINKEELPHCIQTHQGNTSLLLELHDMELTGCTTVAIDTESNELQSASNIASNVPHSIPSHTAYLNAEQTGISETVNEKSGNVFPLLNTKGMSQIARMNKDTQKFQDLHKKSVPSLADMGLVKDPTNSKIYEASNLIAKDLNSSEEDCNMEISRDNEVPFEEHCYGDFNQEETTKENAQTLIEDTHQRSFKERQHALPENKTLDRNEVIPEAIAVKKEQSASVKSRRRSLADLQARLRHIAQNINEPNMLAGNVTAPIVNFTVSEIPADIHSDVVRFQDPAMETLTFKNEDKSSHIEGMAPFSLKKKTLTARLSLGVVKPKLPVPLKLPSPCQTQPTSTKHFQVLYLDTHSIQNSLIDVIDNEVFPEDLSDTVLSYLSNKKEEQKVHLGEYSIENDALESGMNVSQCEKTSCETTDEEDKGKKFSVISGDSSSTSDAVHNGTCLMAKTINDSSGNSSTHFKCEAISEPTLRNIQLDPQADGTMDHKFDFYKKLEDGSITVNEFLTHFGANFVIHKSRPSALPDKFRAVQTSTMEDLLREKYIYRPKQTVYETDCQNLTEMGERLKTQMAKQNRTLGSINAVLLQDMCAFSNVQLQSFGGKLKERRMHFRKRSKALSHEMKKVLYSELLKTTQDAQQNLMAKITETSEMLKDIDQCLNDLQSELAAVDSVVIHQQSPISTRPPLKAKQQELQVLSSDVAETEKQICELEVKKVALLETQEKLKDETKGLEYHITTLNSLNEWKLGEKDDNGAVFTFLHDTLQLQVKSENAEKQSAREDVEQNVAISIRFLLDSKSSQSQAGMVHKLLGQYIKLKTIWNQKYHKIRHIPLLLHDISVVVSRLRLLGEEIHQLKNWGGLKLGILHITCVDTLIEITFSSIKTFTKFELSLAVNSDYPFVPLQIQKFQNDIGNTRVSQIEDILSSVTPTKNYLTKVVSRIHAELVNTCF